MGVDLGVGFMLAWVRAEWRERTGDESPRAGAWPFDG